MKFEELVDFITNRMSMQQVYQPVLIRTLVDTGGSATFRQLAQVFLLHDESQVLYYEKRIKEMLFRVLQKHGVVTGQPRFREWCFSIAVRRIWIGREADGEYSRTV